MNFWSKAALAVLGLIFAFDGLACMFYVIAHWLTH
jgi:hypothetical protein